MVHIGVGVVVSLEVRALWQAFTAQGFSEGDVEFSSCAHALDQTTVTVLGAEPPVPQVPARCAQPHGGSACVERIHNEPFVAK